MPQAVVWLVNFLAVEGAIAVSTAVAIGTFAATYGAMILLVGGLAYSSMKQREAASRAKDAYNASQVDRLATIASTVAPRELVMGRVRKAGAPFFKASTGRDSQDLYIVLALAGHKIDGIEWIYLNDVKVELDVDGNVLTAPYARTVTTSARVLIGDPFLPGHIPESVALEYEYIPESNPVPTGYYTYQYATVNSYVKIWWHLGGPGQTVDTELEAAFPADWPAVNVVEGVAYLVVKQTYNETAFPSGAVSVTAVIRGAELYDPRTGLTVWSENPALMLRHVYQHNKFGKATISTKEDERFIVAANACDTTTVYTISGGGTPGTAVFFLEDTFTGIGNLATHVGETGATWSLLYGGSPSGFALDGSGNTKAGSNGFSDYALSTGVPSSDDYNMDMDVIFDHTGWNSRAYASLYALNDGSSYKGFEATLFLNNIGSGLKLYVNIVNMSAVENYFSVNVDTGIASGDPINMRVEITNFRKTSKLYINNVLVDEHTLASTSPPVPLVSGFALGTSYAVSTIVSINRVRGWSGTLPTGSVAQPQPPCPLYRSSIVIPFGTAPRSAFDDLAQAMGGSWAYAGGELFLKAGVYTASVKPITDSDLATTVRSGASETQRSINISVHKERTQKFNTVKAMIWDQDQDYKQVDLEPLVGAALKTRDGVELTQELNFPAIGYAPQALHVAGIIMRDARDPLTVELPLKTTAYYVELFDTVDVTLSRYGWSAKTFQVIGRQWTSDASLLLTLKETTAAITTVDAEFLPQGFASNTNLPKPWDIAKLGDITAYTGTSELKKQNDGTVVSHMRLTWAPVADMAVVQHGHIEIRYRLSNSVGPWTVLSVTGDETEVSTSEVQDGAYYLVQGRTRTTVAVSDWNTQILVQILGKTEPPQDVTAFSIAGDILNWTAVTDLDLKGYLLRFRYGSSYNWDSATPMHEGVITESPYVMVTRPSGAVTIMIKAVDTSGNVSLHAAAVVTNLADPDVANIVEEINFDALGFPGTITGGSIVVADFADTFTGAAGPITSHVADTGQSWTSFDGVSTTDFDLNGSGQLAYSVATMFYPDSTHKAVTSGVTPYGDYTASAVFEQPISGPAGYTQRAYMRCIGNMFIYLGWEVVFSYNGSSDPMFFLGIYTSTEYVQSSLYFTTIGTPVKVSVVVSNSGKQFDLYADDVWLETCVTVTSIVPAELSVAAWAEGSATGDISVPTISSVQFNQLGAVSGIVADGGTVTVYVDYGSIATAASIFNNYDVLTAIVTTNVDYGSSGDYTDLTYITQDIDITTALVGSIATLSVTSQGEGLSIDYRFNGLGSFYGQDDLSFYEVDNQSFYGEPGPWIPWPGQLEITNNAYQFRVQLSSSGIQGKIFTMSLVIDAPDMEETVDDLFIVAGGTIIPYTKPFTAIKNVQITLQTNASGAETVEVDKTLPLAPTVYVYNAAHVSVSGASADIRLKGY